MAKTIKDDHVLKLNSEDEMVQKISGDELVHETDWNNLKVLNLKTQDVAKEDQADVDAETSDSESEKIEIDDVDESDGYKIPTVKEEADSLSRKIQDLTAEDVDDSLTKISDDVTDEEIEQAFVKSSKVGGGKFNELSNYKLLTKEEEQALGAEINKAFDEMLKCVCITNVIRKYIFELGEKLQNPYSYEQAFEENFNIDKFQGERLDFRLFERIRGLMDNFLNLQAQLRKKNKGSQIKHAISSNNLNSIPGMERLIETFHWTNINKSFVLDVVNDIRNIIKNAHASYDLIEKNRLNKKKKDQYHQEVVENAEEQIGIPFKYALEFLKYLNSLTYMQNKARNKLALSNLRLVGFVASSFREKGIDYSTLIQFGCHGLLKGILGFDFQKGTRLCTYTSFWIRQAMSRGSLKSRIIGIPSHLIDCFNKFKKARNALSNSGKDLADYSDEDIATQAGLDYSLVQKAQREIKQTGSLDKFIGDNDQKVMLEEVLSSKVEDPMTAYIECEKAKTANYALLQVSAGSEASIRVRNLNMEEARSMLQTHLPSCSGQSMNNKQSRYAFLSSKLGPGYDPKIGARQDIGAVSTMKKCITPVEIDMQTTRSANLFNKDVYNEKKFIRRTTYAMKLQADNSSKSSAVSMPSASDKKFLTKTSKIKVLKVR
jgi:RNA polymerase primary sigma factor